MPQPPVLDHHAGHASRRVEDHHQEEQAEVEEPRGGQAGHRHLQHGDEQRAEDGPEEVADAAHESHHDHQPGGVRVQRLRGNDLVVQRGEPASHPGEEPGEDDHQEPHHLRVVADELGALGIVAHRVRDAP